MFFQLFAVKLSHLETGEEEEYFPRHLIVSPYMAAGGQINHRHADEKGARQIQPFRKTFCDEPHQEIHDLDDE